MGMNHGAKVLSSLRGLSIRHAVIILQGLARRRGMTIPVIDVDCSNVCFKVGKNAQSVASFLMRWASPRFHVVPCCDAKVRPVSKQATNHRKADRDKTTSKPLSSGRICASFVVVCIVMSHRHAISAELYNPKSKQAGPKK